MSLRDDLAAVLGPGNDDAIAYAQADAVLAVLDHRPHVAYWVRFGELWQDICNCGQSIGDHALPAGWRTTRERVDRKAAVDAQVQRMAEGLPW